MTSTTLYQPGVCNIGPAEIRQRRRIGWIGLAVTVVFLIVVFAIGIPAPWRLFVFLPAAIGANGFLQAGMHFCVGFAQKGLFNFGELGAEEPVYQAEYRRKDQRKAVLIMTLSAVAGAVVAVAALLVPLR